MPRELDIVANRQGAKSQIFGNLRDRKVKSDQATSKSEFHSHHNDNAPNRVLSTLRYLYRRTFLTAYPIFGPTWPFPLFPWRYKALTTTAHGRSRLKWRKYCTEFAFKTIRCLSALIKRQMRGRFSGATQIEALADFENTIPSNPFKSFRFLVFFCVQREMTQQLQDAYQVPCCIALTP